MKLCPCGSSNVWATCSAPKHVSIGVVLAVVLLTTLSACGGGSNTGGSQSSGGDSPNPALVSLRVMPAQPSVAAGNTQQFTATGTFSDNSTQDLTSTATWSSSSTAVATVNGAGLATLVAAGTTTIKAISGSISGATSLTVTPEATSTVQISALSETTANPFDLLTITGSGFSNGTAAISVMFIPESGDPIVMLPVSVSDPSNFQVMVPPFFDSAGHLAAETVDVQVVAYSRTTTFASNTITGLQVNGLPAVSAPAGAITAALLSASVNMASSLQTVASGNSIYANLSAPLAQFTTDLGPIASAVNTLAANPAQSSVTIPTANGQTATLTVQELAQADQLARALVAAIVKQGEIPIATSTGNCPVPTGDSAFDGNLCSMQQYFQGLAAQAAIPAVRQRISKKVANPRPQLLTKPQAALVAVVFNVGVGVIAEACEPAGGYLAYELVVAPVVTSAVSLLATEDLPLNTTQAAVAYEKAFGLTLLDGVFFEGYPVLSASADSIDVGIALYGDITLESPTPYGMVNYEGPIPPSSLDYYGSGGALVGENIQPPTPNMPPDSLTLVLPPKATPYTLSLHTTGPGSGSIGSFPSGTSFPAGTVVGLTAMPSTSSAFAGWGGDCSGEGACSVTMNANHSVSATFTSGVADAVTPSISLGSVGGCSGGSISGTINVTAAPGVTWTWPPAGTVGDPTLTFTPASGSGSAVVTVTDTRPPQTPAPGDPCSNTEPISEASYITLGFSDGGSSQITVSYTYIYVIY